MSKQNTPPHHTHMPTWVAEKLAQHTRSEDFTIDGHLCADRASTTYMTDREVVAANIIPYPRVDFTIHGYLCAEHASTTYMTDREVGAANITPYPSEDFTIHGYLCRTCIHIIHD